MPPIPACVPPCVATTPLAAIPITDAHLALYAQVLFMVLVTVGAFNVLASNPGWQTLLRFAVYIGIAAMFCTAITWLPHGDLEVFTLCQEALFIGMAAFTLSRLSAWLTEHLAYGWRSWRYRRAVQ